MVLGSWVNYWMLKTIIVSLKPSKDNLTSAVEKLPI